MLYPFLYIVAVLVVASLILYFAKTAPDTILDPVFKWLIRAIVIIVTVILVLYWGLGLISGGGVPYPLHR
jgi:uncharacterized membrane protein